MEISPVSFFSEELSKKVADGDKKRMEDWRRVVGALNTEKKKLQSYLDETKENVVNVDTGSIDFDISGVIIELDKRGRRRGEDLRADNDGLNAKVAEKDAKILKLRSEAADLRDSLNADMQKLREKAGFIFMQH